MKALNLYSMLHGSRARREEYRIRKFRMSEKDAEYIFDCWRILDRIYAGIRDAKNKQMMRGAEQYNAG